MARATSDPVLLTGSVIAHNEDCACPDNGSLLVFDGYTGNADNDCACADTPAALSGAQPTMPILWARAADVAITPLHDAFHLAFSPFAPDSVLSSKSNRVPTAPRDAASCGWSLRVL